MDAIYVKSFANTKYLLARLSKAERSLLDHITLIMDADTNIFVNDTPFRQKFNDTFKSIGAPTYSDSTISKCLSQIKKLSIITSVPKWRGAYMVNPIYFVKGSEQRKRNTNRDILIQKFMESSTWTPILNRDNS